MNKVQELYVENIARERLNLRNPNIHNELAMPCTSVTDKGMDFVQTFAHCLEMEDIFISKIESGKIKVNTRGWSQSGMEPCQPLEVLFSDVDILAELEDRVTQIVVVEGAREAFKVSLRESGWTPTFKLDFVKGTDTPVEKIYEELEFIHKHFCSAKLTIQLDYANNAKIKVTIPDFLSDIMTEIKEKKKAEKAK